MRGARAGTLNGLPLEAGRAGQVLVRHPVDSEVQARAGVCRQTRLDRRPTPSTVADGQRSVASTG